MGRPLVAACAAFAAGAYLGLGRDFQLALALACGMAAAGLIVALRWKRAAPFFSALRSAFSAAAAREAHRAMLRSTALSSTRRSIAAAREALLVEGRVLESEPRPRACRWSSASTGSRRNPATPRTTRQRTRSQSSWWNDQPLARGSRHPAVRAAARSARALNPGERDRRRDLALRGIAYQGSAEAVELLERGPRLWQLVADLRPIRGRCADVGTTPGRAGLPWRRSAWETGRSCPPEIEIDLAASGLSTLASSAFPRRVALLVRWVARRAWLRMPGQCARDLLRRALCAAPAVIAEVASSRGAVAGGSRGIGADSR